MKNVLFLSIFISLSSYSKSSCELSFYKSYIDKNTEYKIQVLPKGKINKALDNVKNLSSTKEKVLELERQYRYLFSHYRTKTEQLEEIIRASSGKVEASQIQAALKQIKLDATVEIAPLNNRIVNYFSELLEEAGVPVSVKIRKDAYGVSFKYLVLDTTKESSLQSIKTLQRYQARFGTKEVTFDLLENIQHGSGGFSQSIAKRIDLGVSGIKNIVLDDLITMIGKHEFYHASFANMRVKNISSIYHPSYIATGESTISKVPTGYNRYMSAEELYNWANNSTWASERLKDIAKFNHLDVMNDLKSINAYIDGTTKIGAQTKEATESFIKYITSIENKIKNNEAFYFQILTSENKMAYNVDEAFYLVLQRGDGVAMKYFINNEVKRDVVKILEKRAKLLPEFDKRIKLLKGNEEEIQKAMTDYVIAEFSGLEKETLNILDKIKQDQEVLHKVALAVEKESSEISKESKALMESVSEAYKTNQEFYKEKMWQDAFHDMALKYRRLGNIVKENYKGFSGL